MAPVAADREETTIDFHCNATKQKRDCFKTCKKLTLTMKI
jgi:hypothetical protein